MNTEELLVSFAGDWTVLRDSENRGVQEGWARRIPREAADRLRVPGTKNQHEWTADFYYSNLYPDHQGYVWFYRSFSVTALPEDGTRVRLEFDSAGYLTDAYVNGAFAGHHEMLDSPFSFDVTGLLREGENLLAVRCFHPIPGGAPVDGIELTTIPNCVSCSRGGLLGEVRLVTVPAVRVDGIFVRPDAESGSVRLELTLENSSAAASVRVNAVFTEQKTGSPAAALSRTVTVPAGKSVHTFACRVPSHKLWSVDRPALYLCQISLNDRPLKTVRFGFRSLELRHGFFFLNGKRFLLKSAHVLPTAEVLIGLKSAGFNACRFLSRVPDPELLELCDEMGLLVIEEAASSWGMRDHPRGKEQLYAAMDAMILRDRNHPCVFAYGVFNELCAFGTAKRAERPGRAVEAETFRAGVSYLGRLRELDPDRFVFLSSGRFDGDRSVGSVSCPGSDSWDFVWGAEGDAQFVPKLWKRNYTNAFTDLDGLGDLHPYAKYPMDADTKTWFRTVARDTRPVFISEAGIGSQTDPIRQGLLGNPAFFARLTAFLENFLAENGFSDLFAFPESFCEETERQSGRYRESLFNVIRANPMICGYSLTSACYANEGLFSERGIFKPTVFRAMQTGWAPLRWSLFSTDRTVYADRPFRVEAVLCNEDVLSPGEYAAEARIHGAGGTPWKRSFRAVYPSEGPGGLPPLAAKVLDEEVTLPEGDWELQVKLKNAVVHGDRLPVKAVRVRAERAAGKRVAAWGLSGAAADVLEAYGVSVGRPGEAEKLLLVGAPEDLSAGWDRTLRFARAGGTVVFLCPEIFHRKREPSDDQFYNMPMDVFTEERSFRSPLLTALAGENACCVPFHNWLYHVDTIHADHPIFAHTTPAGVLDMEVWGELCPTRLFLDLKKPDAVLAAGIGLCVEIENNTAASQALCVYTQGAGRVVLNGFQIAENLGLHPFADQLLLNLIALFG